MKRLFQHPGLKGRDGEPRSALPPAPREGIVLPMLLVGLATYLAALALGAGAVLGALAERWERGLAQELTVELPASTPVEEVEQIVQRLRARDDVLLAEPFAGAKLAELVQPWLGPDLDVTAFPLPVLIGLTVSEQADPTALAAELDIISPEARLETHGAWRAELGRLADSLRWVAWVTGLAVVLVGASATAIAGVARLQANRQLVTLLRDLGASDSAIARPLEHSSATLALIGASCAVLAALATFVAVGSVAGAARTALLPRFAFSAGPLIGLIALAPAAGLTALLATRIAVRRLLERLA